MSNEVMNQQELWPIEGGKFYQAVIEISHVTVDDKGKEKDKKEKLNVLVRGKDIDDAKAQCDQFMKGEIDPYEITKIEVSKINAVAY